MHNFDPNIHEFFSVEQQLWGSMRKLYGVKDKSGNIIIDAKYTKLEHLGEGILMTMYAGAKSLIDLDEHEIVPLHAYNSFTPFAHGYSRVFRAGKCGLIDKQGNLVLPCVFYGMWAPNPMYDSIVVRKDETNVWYKINLNELRPGIPYREGDPLPSMHYEDYLQKVDQPDPDDSLTLDELYPMDTYSSSNSNEDDIDWRKESYYALTDGEYGDYEDGEIDPDCLGF